MNSLPQFSNSSDDDLLILWSNKSTLNSDDIQALLFELEKRRLAKVVHTIAGLPKVELLRTPPIVYELSEPLPRTLPPGITRLLFTITGVFLAVVIRLSIPSVRNLSSFGPLIIPLLVMLLVPLSVFSVLNRIWKPFALLVTSIVALVLTGAFYWYIASGNLGGKQVQKEIESSSARFLNTRKQLEEELGRMNVPGIVGLLSSPDNLTLENLEDAVNRIAKAQKVLEDYRLQNEERLQLVQKALQAEAETNQIKNLGTLKETLSVESDWLDSKKLYFSQISEFVRFMRYYRHLYKVVNHQVVFSEADSRNTYEYYKTQIQALSEHQKKVDLALSSQLQLLTSITR